MLVALWGVACSSDAAAPAGTARKPETASGGTSAAGTAGAASFAGTGAGGSAGVQVTWASDVAPIVFRECVACHRSGGIAPFSLTTFADALPRGRAMAFAVAERHMPPMPVNGSGDCNTYANARWLTDAEIDVFARWLEHGLAEGDPSKLPALPAAPTGLDRVDHSLDIGVDYLSTSTGHDDYRCFLVDPGIDEDEYLVGYEVIPGDARIVHHAILFQPHDEEEVGKAQALDAAEAGPGYTCFATSGVEADPIALWAPGGGPTRFPAGTGLLLAERRKLVLQVHYNLDAGHFPDRTSIRLQVEPTVSRTARFQPIADLDLSVAPNQELGISSRTYVVDPPASNVVYGVLPHMHTSGRTLRLDASLDGEDVCLVDVDRWDFHWQNAWWYDKPLTGAAKSVTLSCGYDTRGRTAPVTWGEGTADEMCLVYLYVTPP